MVPSCGQNDESQGDIRQISPQNSKKKAHTADNVADSSGAKPGDLFSEEYIEIGQLGEKIEQLVGPDSVYPLIPTEELQGDYRLTQIIIRYHKPGYSYLLQRQLQQIGVLSDRGDREIFHVNGTALDGESHFNDLILPTALSFDSPPLSVSGRYHLTVLTDDQVVKSLSIPYNPDLKSQAINPFLLMTSGPAAKYENGYYRFESEIKTELETKQIQGQISLRLDPNKGSVPGMEGKAEGNRSGGFLVKSAIYVVVELDSKTSSDDMISRTFILSYASFDSTK